MEANEGVAPISDRRLDNPAVIANADLRPPPPAADDTGPTEFDESAESAFLADARERGEVIVAPKTREETADETDTKALPPLNELVERIPAEVREALDDLFRARFVSVKRVPKRALKT